MLSFRAANAHLILAIGLFLSACGGADDTARPDPIDDTTGQDNELPGGDSSGDGDAGPSGDGGTVGDGDTASGDGDGIVLPPLEPPADPPPGYPEGPYGVGDPEVGDIVENLTFFGFKRIDDGVLVNAEDPQSITFSEIRDEGKRYALVHTATIWCPSCRAAADDLAARGDELSQLDAVLIELVLEGPSYDEPTDEELGTWIVGSDLTITTVRPGDDRTALVFPSREYAYVIDLQTMTVVWAKQALFTDPTITEDGIDALLDVLN